MSPTARFPAPSARCAAPSDACVMLPWRGGSPGAASTLGAGGSAVCRTDARSSSTDAPSPRAPEAARAASCCCTPAKPCACVPKEPSGLPDAAAAALLLGEGPARGARLATDKDAGCTRATAAASLGVAPRGGSPAPAKRLASFTEWLGCVGGGGPWATVRCGMGVAAAGAIADESRRPAALPAPTPPAAPPGRESIWVRLNDLLSGNSGHQKPGRCAARDRGAPRIGRWRGEGGATTRGRAISTLWTFISPQSHPLLAMNVISG